MLLRCLNCYRQFPFKCFPVSIPMLAAMDATSFQRTFGCGFKFFSNCSSNQAKIAAFGC